MSAFQHIFYRVKTYIYDIYNFIGQEKKEILNLNLSFFWNRCFRFTRDKVAKPN